MNNRIMNSERVGKLVGSKLTQALKALSITGLMLASVVVIAEPADSSNQGSVNSFQDCVNCPEMVVIPAGSFAMGSPQSEPQRQFAETPQRDVNVPAFSISAKAVTFDQWDACVTSGGCDPVADDQGWGRGERPVINVSWHDAQDYVEWLSTEAGQIYRLPSEAEWEYAARAGSTGRFHTGDCITTDQANFQGGAPATDCPGGEFRLQTLPVGEFDANAWGLYDMHGNVWEWVQDCWNFNYFSAPDDGSAWMSGDCSAGVLRGGSWAIGGRAIRSATRAWDARTVGNQYRGFRVATSATSGL
jgi:eukaryotic-like serine/threonine-protein kinase